MRTLVFDGQNEEHQEAFAILYQGFLLGAPQGGLRGLSAHRDALKILEKMEAISIPQTQKTRDEDGVEVDAPVRLRETGDQLRTLNEDEELELVLEENQYEMLLKHVENTPFRIGVAKQVVFAIDFLKAGVES